jgi:hypothetical protein
MLRSETARFARRTSWLLVFLCTALLAWRVDYRIEQCRASSAQTHTAVAFFDTNERNLASVDAALAYVHFASEAPQLLFCVGSLAAEPQQQTKLRRPETAPALPDIPLHSFSLYANPPPSLA